MSIKKKLFRSVGGRCSRRLMERIQVKKICVLQGMGRAERLFQAVDGGGVPLRSYACFSCCNRLGPQTENMTGEKKKRLHHRSNAAAWGARNLSIRSTMQRFCATRTWLIIVRSCAFSSVFSPAIFLRTIFFFFFWSFPPRYVVPTFLPM